MCVRSEVVATLRAAMTSYADRNAPPSPPLGETIPQGVRHAIVGWFEDRGVDVGSTKRRFRQRQGYGGIADLVGDVGARWGDDAARRLNAALKLPAHIQLAEKTFHLAMPEPLYLSYVEDAIAILRQIRAEIAEELLGDVVTVADAVDYLNGLFVTRGLSYRFTADGYAEWHGDAGVHAEVIAPALAVLADPRLAGCRSEFEAALRHLRAGTPKDHEDAIEEAGKAVESAMKVLLGEKGIALVGTETAEPLWTKLRDAQIVPTKTKDAMLSTSRLRNEYGGHGTGAAPRSIPQGIPALAVQASASAIYYLASLL